ncbi:MAG: tetratricopeptide repeat protein [Candidatus Krumholzibacteria bacterium]|nr:tetratricopeptide repeat protein [Candidatus Krumholzibacteria bacterium]
MRSDHRNRLIIPGGTAPAGFRLPLLILAVAFAVRLVYVLGLRGTPPGELLLIDSETYDRLARALLGGGIEGEEAYAVNVLYPYFLAGVYAVAGGAKIAVLVAQAMLDSLTCVLIFLAATRLAGRATALVCAGIAVLYAPLVAYSGAILTPTLVTFLAALALFLLVIYQERPSWRTALAGGAVIGLATLGRGNHLLLVPLCGVFFFLAAGSRKTALRHWGALALGALLVIAPFNLRNYLVARQWVPVAANYAAFYIGHNPEATGLYAMPSFTESARFDSEVWGTRDAVARKLGRPVTLAESSRYLLMEGVRYAAAHPLEELRLAARKFHFFWNRTEPPTNLSYYFAREFSPLLRGLPLDFGIVGPFVLLGLWLSRREPRRFVLLWIFVAVNLLTALLFFVSAEYRLPMLPAAIVLAGYALVRLVRAVRTRPSPGMPVALAVLAAAALFVNIRPPILQRQSLLRVDYLNFGRLYLDRGEHERARFLFGRSLAIDPNYALAYESLAELSRREGDDSAALQYAQRAWQLGASSAQGARTPEAEDDAPLAPAPAGPAGPSPLQDRILELGALYKAGRWSEAREGFQALLGDAWAHGDTALAIQMQNNVGLCYFKIGDLARAEEAFCRIIDLSPGYVKAYNNLGLVREARGRTAEAAEAYEAVLERQPGNVVARRALSRLRGAPGTSPR